VSIPGSANRVVYRNIPAQWSRLYTGSLLCDTGTDVGWEIAPLPGSRLSRVA